MLRVLTKEEIQKLADRTKRIRGMQSRSLYHAPPSSSDVSSEEDLDDRRGVFNSARRLRRFSDSSMSAPPSPTDSGMNEQGRRSLGRRAWTADAAQSFINIVRNTLIELSKTTDERYEEEKEAKRAERREARHRDRGERDEYEDDSENEFKPRAPRMLEAPASTVTGASSSDAGYVHQARDRRDDRERDRETHHMSGGLGHRRDDGY